MWPEAPAAEVPSCPRCKQPRHLLLQAFAPHEAHSSRFLLLFACNSIRCSENADTWLAWRVCQTEPDKDHTQNSTLISTDACRQSETTNKKSEFPDVDWDSSDYGTDSSENDTDLSDSLQMLSLEVDLARAKKRLRDPPLLQEGKHAKGLTSGASSTALQTTKENGQKSGIDKTSRSKLFSEGPTFPATSVRVEEEKHIESGGLEADRAVNALLQKYLLDENERKQNCFTESWVAETDDDEQCFSKPFDSYREALSSAPEQVLRYSFGHKPLWPTHSLQLPKSPCSCGSELVYEFQLLSPCLYFLGVDSHLRAGQSDAGMNFATAAVYTCAKDCEAARVAHKTGSWQVFEQFVVVCPDEW